jgi:hypothetical protein
MTEANKAQSVNWEAESLRLTAFVHPSAQVKPQGWWASLTGVDPENRTEKPSRGELSEWGKHLKGTLSLMVQPGRVDWFLVPVQPTDLSDLDIPQSLGDFSPTGWSFVELMSKWLPSSPPTIRLAFGSVLNRRVGSKRDGYKELAKFMNFVKVDEASSDFFYQINRPRSVNFEKNVLINRLSKWAVGSAQLLRVAMMPAPAVSGAAAVYSPADSLVFNCRLELDISTPAQLQDEIPATLLVPILQELFKLGEEISVKGDIP